MRFKPAVVSACVALLFAAQISLAKDDEQTIVILPVDRPQDSVESAEAPIRKSLTTGDDIVSIHLNDTGIADWRFANPRKPQKVGENINIEFINDTADRTFEVTVTVAARPSDLISGAKPLPVTVPLVVYDALLDIEDERPAPDPKDQSIADFERARIEEAKVKYPEDRFPGFGAILDSVLELEEALRDRAVKVTEENARRADLMAINGKPGARVEDIQPIRDLALYAEERRTAADERIRRLREEGGSLEKKRKALIEHLGAEVESLQRANRSSRNSDAKRDRRLALLKVAIDALKNQSDDAALLLPLRRAFPSIRLEGCSAGAVATCTASLYIYPNGSGTFPHSVLRFQADPTAPVLFNVKFFEEDETPAKPTAFLVAGEQKGETAPPQSVVKLLAVASVGASKEPFLLDRTATSRNCPLLCKDLPYDGADKSHMTGSGRVELTQTYSNLIDGKVSLSFKDGDLGGGDGTVDVKLSQYRFNIYSERGIILGYGKFQFAAPSSGIAINETGEGIRLSYRNIGVARIIKRESGKNVADRENRDNSTWILEATNMSLTDFLKKRGMLPEDQETGREKFLGRLFRTASLIALLGDDRKGEEKRKDTVTNIEETVFTAHKYETYGGQIGFTQPGLFYGTLSGYWSERKADEKDAPCGDALHVCDGRGNVGLLTVTKPFPLGEDGKPTGNLTLTWGRGSGDDPSTTTKDEGYIGETAGFAPDQIFLATFAGAISNRDFFDAAQYKDDTDPMRDLGLKQQFRLLDIGVAGLGRGLSNKEYYGAKLVSNTFSFLAWVACIKEDSKSAWGCFIPKSDIRSKATFLTLHHYRLRRPLVGNERDAGIEADLEFNVETPRGVKVNLKGAYYWPGKAVEPFISKRAWSISSGITLSL